MKILYIHGVASSGKSNTAKVLKEEFGEDNVLSPDIAPKPMEAYSQIKELVRTFNPNIVVGTSLGGFYASLFGGPIKVLVNPLLTPDEHLAEIIGGYGKYPYLKERGDGATEFEYTQEDEEALRELRRRFNEDFLDTELIGETFALFGWNDTVVNDIDEYHRIYGTFRELFIPAGHRLTEEQARGALVPWLRFFERAASKRSNPC